VYNIGFETTEEFDEIQITVGALASVLNIIDVYGAFVDTKNSDGGSLDCPDPPIAADDAETTPEDTPVIIDVLNNDSDSDSPLGVPSLSGAPGFGTAVVNGDSTITYTPDPNFVGVDSFSYEICDDRSPPLCDIATVVVTVTPVMDTIVESIAEDDTLTVCADSLTTFTEPAGSIAVCDGPSNGTATVVGTCVQYVPDADYVGNDTLCLIACDPNDPMLCDTTVAFITIGPANDPPVALPDADTTNEDTPIVIDVLNNDSDIDNPLGIPAIVDDPIFGTVSVNGDSTITYSPDENFVGIDSFTYTICDGGAPPLCDPATVVITVLPVTDTITHTI
jgi:hypothetical protein